MASIGITVCTHREHMTKKPRRATAASSLQTAPPDADNLKFAKKPDMSSLLQGESRKEVDDSENSDEPSYTRFSDVRWKNGTWDLNMFVEKGRMDWDAVIVAEAKRRKFLELYPQASTNEEPVLFRTSIVPWWAWMTHSHLPEAELLNGRAAMVGFFAAYIVDALTGLDVVGQTSNFICKGALFLIIIGVIVFRRKEDFENVRKLADEATFYDKQWRASWTSEEATKEQIAKDDE